jgi:predicted enzyme related to lactoylglutathione lyase
MATMTQHAPGTFCWPELATNDQPGAKRFYTSLFGWGFEDSPIGEGEVYTMLKLGDRQVGALFQMRQEQAGLPPHWSAYVAVADADAAAAQAAKLGGKVIMAPFDVMDVGRMALIQDPQGAVVAVWQARKHFGAGVLDEPGALCWTELLTTDPAAASRFYTGLFGWTAEATQMGPTAYTVFKRGDKSAGGMMAIAPEMGPMPPHWLGYFAVEDCDESVAKAIMLGGEVALPPTEVPGVGRFSVLNDPQGAAFAIVGQPKPGS